MGWTDERVDLLKRLWSEGLSASQIAQKLGGVTRNAVIGKVHRLGLSGRATPSRPARRSVKPAIARPVRAATPASIAAAPRPAPPPPAPVEPALLPSGEFATVLTLSSHICKWPIGDPDDANFRFCGRHAGAASPYCEAHARVAYQPQKKRTRRPNSDAAAVLNSLAAARRTL
jgi:GcrA cell cycle regulator